MKNRKVIPVWLSAILVVISIGMLARYGYKFAINRTIKILDLLACLAYMSTLVYCFGGLSKKAATFYKLFLFFFLLIPVIDIVTYFKEYMTGGMVYNLSFATNIINFVLMIPLTFAKDLGKKKSLNYAYVALALNLLCLVIYIIEGTIAPIQIINFLSLVAIRTIVVYAKYKDKEARGTK